MRGLSTAAPIALCLIAGPGAGQAAIEIAGEPLFEVGAVGSPEYLEDVVAVAHRSGGGYWVLDRGARRVLLVSETGAVEAWVGREGEGPGEFSSPSAVVEASTDGVVVFDSGMQRFTTFGADGRYRQTLSLDQGVRPAREVRGVAGRWLAVEHDQARTAGGAGLARDTIGVAFVDGGEWTQLLRRMPATLTSVSRVQGRTAVRIAPFSPVVAVGSNGVCAVVAVTDDPHVMVVGDSGVVGVVDIGLSPRRAGPGDWDALRTRMLEVVPEESRWQVEPMLDLIERPEAVPGFGGVVLDESGLVWAPLWGAEPGFASEWRIHDGSGLEIARVDFDRPTRLLHVGHGTAVGVYLDDLDAQVLTGWKVTRRGEPAGVVCD